MQRGKILKKCQTQIKISHSECHSNRTNSFCQPEALTYTVYGVDCTAAYLSVFTLTKSDTLYLLLAGYGLHCSQLLLHGADTDDREQGRIYVANDYPIFARTILIVCQKSRISRQNFFE